MSDAEKLAVMELENMRLKDENQKLRQTIGQMNKTIARLLSRYICSQQTA